MQMVTGVVEFSVLVCDFSCMIYFRYCKWAYLINIWTITLKHKLGSCFGSNVSALHKSI